MSSACPSAAADRYFADLDDASAAEAAFWKEHRALIVQVAAALAPTSLPASADRADISAMVDVAGRIVDEIVNRGELE